MTKQKQAETLEAICSCMHYLDQHNERGVCRKCFKQCYHIIECPSCGQRIIRTSIKRLEKAVRTHYNKLHRVRQN